MSEWREIQSIPPWAILVIALLLLTQGTALFLDARRRGLGRMAWFWGVWGILNVPTPLVVYYFLILRRGRGT
ncbi:hypothetical protein JJQ72_16175 [Paenibacillus sp. F411]|uniref:hypothetical protein n=1 Tax=unclassified Paenibacillus TaxID=185978 RepID=UPI001AAFA3F3|nr:hypothetical protein [Paenibacillus sp. F411]MBO2945515.1 hypothetical protein [Paenibacillus sp. F411]